LGIVTSTSETAFTHSAEAVYDFVTNPDNWTKTYPGSAHIGKLPRLPANWARLTPAPAVHDTLAVFCNGGGFVEGTTG
jgi:hypothetical protein